MILIITERYMYNIFFKCLKQVNLGQSMVKEITEEDIQLFVGSFYRVMW